MVSIIIPVRNAARTIEKTFEYLFNVDYPRDRWEIVIADGGSNDETLDIIARWQKLHPFIKLVKIKDSPSPAFARNQALGEVKGEFIFFTDGDCAPCKEWITEILKHFDRDEKIGIVGGEIYTLRVDTNNLTEAWCEHFRFNMVSPRYGFIKEGYFPPLTDRKPTQIAGHKAYFFVTANVAYRKKAIDESGARFWEHKTGEDIDFCIQVQNAGWKLYFAPKAKVDHMHRATLPALRKVWVTYGMAHPPLLRKHSKDYLEIVFQFLKNNPTIAIPSPVRGFIYLGNFHMMHIFGILAWIFLISAILNSSSVALWIATLIGFFFTIYFKYQYIKWCFSMEPRPYFLTWCWMKYLTNLSFAIGGLKGSVKYKTFCIEPSF